MNMNADKSPTTSPTAVKTSPRSLFSKFHSLRRSITNSIHRSSSSNHCNYSQGGDQNSNSNSNSNTSSAQNSLKSSSASASANASGRNNAITQSKQKQTPEVDIMKMAALHKHSKINVHIVLTNELIIKDSSLFNTKPLGFVTDEQLIHIMAERNLGEKRNSLFDRDSVDVFNRESTMFHSPKVIPKDSELYNTLLTTIEKATDDQLMSEIDRRHLMVHQKIDRNVILETYSLGTFLVDCYQVLLIYLRSKYLIE